MLLEILKLILGLFLAIKGADILISSSVGLGLKLKVSDFFVGLVIVGFGTSIPELLVSIEAVLSNSANLSVGNILGSNIANILLVFSTLGFVNNIKIKSIASFDIFFHLSMHVIFFLIFNFSTFGKKFGMLFIVFFLIYIIFSLKFSKDKKQINTTNEMDYFSNFTFRKPFLFSLPILIISISLTLFGVDLAVNSAVQISKELKIPDSFIGLSLIAIGTSLPELVVGILSAIKRKVDFALGNILGSNIYNVLGVLGISSFFGKFSIPNILATQDLFFMIFITVLVLFFMLLFKKLTKLYGVIGICLYFSYIYFIYV